MKWIILLLLPVNVFAVGLEQGQSTNLIANPNYYTESKYSALTIRTSGNVFLEGIVGSWYGETSSRFYGLSVGYRSPKRAFYEMTVGGVHLVEYYGDQLDGENQFNLSVGVGYRFDNLSVSVKCRHFSNGAYFFGGDNEKNHGMDFMVVGVGVNF